MSDFALLQCILQVNSEWLSLTHSSLSVSCFHNLVRGCNGGVFNALIFPGKTRTTAVLQDVTVTIVSDEP
jgi:hypothetical protein